MSLWVDMPGLVVATNHYQLDVVFSVFPGKNPKFPCGIWRFRLRKWWMWPMPWGRSPSILHPWGSSWLRAMDWCLTAGWGNKRWQDVTTFCGCGMMWLCKHDASIFETLDTSAMQKKRSTHRVQVAARTARSLWPVKRWPKNNLMYLGTGSNSPSFSCDSPSFHGK